MNENTVNVSAYRFVQISRSRLPEIRQDLLSCAQALKLKGTVLLSTEGINLFVAGPSNNIESFFHKLNTYTEFFDLPRKDSLSDKQPFTRMLVRIKKEIISMGCEEVKPYEKTAPHLSPTDFKQWMDENKDMVILDTRNDYEVKLGSFDSAIDLNIKTFREFPKALDQLPEDIKNKPIVTFCTGGIRCEKAAELMHQKGFNDVYQLDGGILNYFEQCEGTHYNGECFVFDKRVAVDSKLQETSTTQCYACRMPLNDTHPADAPCTHCAGNPLTGEKKYSVVSS